VFDTGIDQNARTQCLEFVERKLEILCYRLKLKQPRLEQSGDNIELKLDCNCWQSTNYSVWPAGVSAELMLLYG